jgi:hypothetical protein
MGAPKQDLTDDLAAITPEALELEALRAKLVLKERELRASRSLNAGQADLIEKLAGTARFRDEASAATLKADRSWLTPKRKRGRVDPHSATIGTVLSDMHFGEVVRAKEIRGRNAYDVAIAEARLQRYFEGVRLLARDYLAQDPIRFDGVALFMPGDGVSGSIHDELRETNELTVPETVKHFTPRIGDGVEWLADEFGLVHVAITPGNHGRFTAKPRAKRRAADNADTMIGWLLQERFAKDDRIRVDVTEGTDLIIPVYDTTFLLTHGDQTRGGGGIGGIWPPLMRMVARKRAADAQYGDTFDYVVMGHWHQLTWGQEFIVNGALKGYDEYAAVSNFQPERAKQAFFIVTPENGITWQAPIFCDDPKSEGWFKAA